MPRRLHVEAVKRGMWTCLARRKGQRVLEDDGRRRAARTARPKEVGLAQRQPTHPGERINGY